MSPMRVSLTSLFLWTTIFALVVSLCYSRYEISRLSEEIAKLNQELDSKLPLRALEIKAQIEHQTAAAKMPVTIINSSFSGSAYLVGFTYFDPQTGALKNSAFTLRYNSKGHYVGAIRDAAFIQPQPDEDGERGLRISVVDPEHVSIAAEYDAQASSNTDVEPR